MTRVEVILILGAAPSERKGAAKLAEAQEAIICRRECVVMGLRVCRNPTQAQAFSSSGLTGHGAGVGCGREAASSNVSGGDGPIRLVGEAFNQGRIGEGH